jgi:DNA-binding CsgD family transcriptional regulator
MSVSVTPIKDRWGDCEGYVLIGQPIRRLADERNSFGLSGREREVCLLLMQGLANQEIAERLYISSGTVKNHLYNIYEKTGVRNRVELSRLLS